jgi:ankyrin repeat protein
MTRLSRRQVSRTALSVLALYWLGIGPSCYKKNSKLNDLCTASGSGDTARIQALLKVETRLGLLAETTMATRRCIGPLYMAAWDAAALLLGNGADVNARGHSGTSPLYNAVWNNHQAIADLLLAQKADVNAKADNGITPLYVAANRGYKQVAELLIANKADVNVKASGGFTPLHAAALGGHKEIAELLLANGANINAVTLYGITPLRLAMRQGNKDVAAFLHEHGGLALPVSRPEWSYP